MDVQPGVRLEAMMLGLRGCFLTCAREEEGCAKERMAMVGAGDGRRSTVR